MSLPRFRRLPAPARPRRIFRRMALCLVLCLATLSPAAAAEGDPARAAGSLRLPEGNNGPAVNRPGLSAWKGALVQSRERLTLAAGDTPQASFAILRLPRDKRYQGPYGAGVFGTAGKGPGTWRMSYGYDSLAAVFNPGRFSFAQRGDSRDGELAELTSPPWTEDEALVVAWTAGDGRWQLDWYSLADGSRHAGDAVFAKVTESRARGLFNIGSTGSFTDYDANGDNGAKNDLRLPWPGEIETIGHVAGRVPSPADWGAIARGAAIRDVIPAGDIRFLRAFDGTEASFGPPSWATADRTAPARPVGSTTKGVPPATLLPGTTFRRQSPEAYALIRMPSAGMVFGLMKDETERSVPFQGLSSGPVELRILNAGTGRVVQDWTPMTDYADGRWSGALTLPESTEGWLFADVRLAADPSVVGYWRNEFGVGWKFQLVGQSNVSTAMKAGRVGVAMTEPMGASYVENIIRGRRETEGDKARYMTMSRIGMAANSDGQIMFVNQIRKYRPKTPIMIYHDAVAGTPMRGFMRGEYHKVHRGDRHYTDMTDKYAAYGDDISVQVLQWGMSDSITVQSIRDLMQAWMYGTGPEAAQAVYFPMKALPRTQFSLVTLDRGARSGDRGLEMTQSRLDFFLQNKALAGNVSPPVADYRTATDDLAGHASPDHLEGGARWAGRAAIGAARALGWDHSTNPYYTNPRLSPDGRRILIDAVAVNGGRIYSTAPDALSGWYVKEGGDPGWIDRYSGRFTARLKGAVVELEKSEGRRWVNGVQVMRRPNPDDREKGEDAKENAIHAGGVYETYPLDAMNGLIDGSAGGTGLPVVGTRLRGDWQLRFAATLRSP